MSTRGVIFVHSSPTAVCPHVEWAISGVLGTRVSLEWTAQPAAPGLLRTECTWSGPAGSAGALAGALRAWPMLRFEVTEEPSPAWTVSGSATPRPSGCGAGARAPTATSSWARTSCAPCSSTRPAAQVAGRLHELLGSTWDAALEPFRLAGDGAPVTWLHQVG